MCACFAMLRHASPCFAMLRHPKRGTTGTTSGFVKMTPTDAQKKWNSKMRMSGEAEMWCVAAIGSKKILTETGHLLFWTVFGWVPGGKIGIRPTHGLLV